MTSKVFTQEQICKDVNNPEITLKKGGMKITSTHTFVFDGKFIQRLAHDGEREDTQSLRVESGEDVKFDTDMVNGLEWGGIAGV